VRRLTNKRVLLVAPPFFGYDDAIAAEIARRGAEVLRITDRPYRSPLATALTKLAPTAIAAAASFQYREELRSHGGGYDLCLVVNGQTLAPGVLKQIRAENPRAAMVLYLWDSLENRPSIRRALSHYDCVLGFDRTDAAKYGFRYRPLFYGDEFKPSSNPASVDVSFAGTAHSDRGPIIWQLENSLRDGVRRQWFLYLQARWVREFYALKDRSFRRVPADFFSYRPMSKSSLAELFARSRAILDIEHPDQRGLTMRTFETIGSGKKLVTTNRNAELEDFFDPDRVLIIDRKAPAIPENFLAADPPPLSPTIKQRYSLASWLEEILVAAGVP
jgi:hypothetical protein